MVMAVVLILIGACLSALTVGYVRGRDHPDYTEFYQWFRG